MKNFFFVLGCGSALAISVAAQSHNHAHTEKPNADAVVTVEIELLDPVKGNTKAGHIYVTESKYGLVFTPDLKGLASGIHGFHIHEKPSCEPKEQDGKLVAGLAAGGHWDPQQAKNHGFPWSDDAHLGDLPALYVDAQGNATQPVMAPRLKSLEEIKGHSLMIHEGGDNHSDHPVTLGGGGPRMACGVIK